MNGDFIIYSSNDNTELHAFNTKTEKDKDESRITKLKSGLSLIDKRDDDGNIIPLTETDIEAIFNKFYTFT